MNAMTSNWLFWAVLSAIFAALTAVFAKIGVSDINSNFATFIRTIVVIAADRKQARTIMRYVRGLLNAVPMLARTIEGERVEAIDLKRRVSIEVHTASFRTTRGYTTMPPAAHRTMP